MKILFVTKDLESKGGVSNLYRLIESEWNNKEIKINFFIVGSSHVVYQRREKRYFGYIIESFKQFYIFRKECRFNKPDIVVVNPSLIPISLIRDGILLLIAKRYKIKVVVFFHGWRNSFIKSLDNNKFLKSIFLHVYGKANHIIVLSKSFKDIFSRFFDVIPISVLYTPYNDRLIRARKVEKNKVTITFISRISIQKGIMELLTAMNQLQIDNSRSFIMNVYGHFSDSETKQKVYAFLKNKNLSRKVIFKGYIEENEKYEVLSKSDLFLLPSWAEGCPTSVIEATAAGCFVIATNVGAIPEIINNNKNGLIIEPKSSNQLYKAIMYYFEHKKEFDANCINNRYLAKQKFEVKSLIQSFEKIFKSLNS